MPTAPLSRSARSTRWLPALAALLVACDSGSSSGFGIRNPAGPGGEGTAPSIGSLSLWPVSAARNEGGGAVSVAVSLAVQDAEADVAELVVVVLDGAGAEVGRHPVAVSGAGQTYGGLTHSVPVPTAALGTFTVEAQVFDARGHASNVLRATFPVVEGNPAPAITSLSPDRAAAGSDGITLTVTGTGFVGASTILWNGSSLPTTYVDATTLRAQVGSSVLDWTGTAQVTVRNPPPGGGLSAAETFTIEPPPPSPVPTLASISPTSADAGGGAFTLTVTGTGFVAASRVLWNGSWLTTTLVDSTTLTATVSSYEISTPRTANVSVYTPTPGGGTSSTLPFTVTRPVQPGVTVVPLKANDLAWDPYERRIYASVPGLGGANANTVTAIDPFSGALLASTWVGSEPDRLGISDDGRFLYVALRGASSVERLALPGLSPELSIGLGNDETYGPLYATDLRVAPGAAHTVAVARAASSSSSSSRLAVYDDATPRATAAVAPSYYAYRSLEWGATAADLYARTSAYGNDLHVLDVDATGVALATTYRYAFSSDVAIRFDPGTGLVYGEDGRAVDPATGVLEGTFPLGTSYSYTRRMVPDSALGAAFFVKSDSYYGPHAMVERYDLTRFTPSGATTLTWVGSDYRRLIRWGTDGLAFLTADSVVLVRGAAVIPLATTDNPAPAIASLSPASGAAGGANFVLQVSGTGFVRGSAVLWNGSERTTTWVSATELAAFVPASDVAAAGSAEVTVRSPAPGGGTSAAEAFTIAP